MTHKKRKKLTEKKANVMRRNIKVKLTKHLKELDFHRKPGGTLLSPSDKKHAVRNLHLLPLTYTV